MDETRRAKLRIGFLLSPLPWPHLTHWDTLFLGANNSDKLTLSLGRLEALLGCLSPWKLVSYKVLTQLHKLRVQKGCHRILSNLKSVQICADEGFSKCRGKEGVA